MGKAIGYLLITTLLISLAGCKFAPVKKRGGGEEAAIGSETETGRTSGIEAGGALDIKALNDPASPLSKRVLYFELDSSQISDEDREIIAAHARFLAAHPDISIVLEGHADERGTREYNLALGERRAKAVQQLLVLQGVDPRQVQVISFGEERPVALDHNESAWRLNRRVEILYSGY